MNIRVNAYWLSSLTLTACLGLPSVAQSYEPHRDWDMYRTCLDGCRRAQHEQADMCDALPFRDRDSLMECYYLIYDSYIACRNSCKTRFWRVQDEKTASEHGVDLETHIATGITDNQDAAGSSGLEGQ